MKQEKCPITEKHYYDSPRSLENKNILADTVSLKIRPSPKISPRMLLGGKIWHLGILGTLLPETGHKTL